jgi:hypothetical protein
LPLVFVQRSLIISHRSPWYTSWLERLRDSDQWIAIDGDSVDTVIYRKVPP